MDRRSLLAWLTAMVVLAGAGCTGLGGGPSDPPGPQPSTCADPVITAAPSIPPKGGCSGEPFTEAELRLLLIDELGPLWYCDRDSFPMARDEQEAAIEAYPDLVADAELFAAVAAKLGIDPAAAHTDAQKLALYRLWKTASAVQLEPIGNDRFRFDYLAQPAAGGVEGKRTGGLVDTHGAITVEQEAAAGEPMCPICLSVGSLIATPGGEVAVDRLKIGDTIWTVDRDGLRLTGTVIALGSTPAPPEHDVIRLTLADGRSVTASPGHPLADGRTIADLQLGDAIDGSTIAGLETIRYRASETYDLVVSGPTGIYFAGGIPLGSTLRAHR
jgi:hypothetical protein